MKLTKTTCPYCGVGCGVLAGADGTIKGDPDHPQISAGYVPRALHWAKRSIWRVAYWPRKWAAKMPIGIRRLI